MRKLALAPFTQIRTSLNTSANTDRTNRDVLYSCTTPLYLMRLRAKNSEFKILFEEKGITMLAGVAWSAELQQLLIGKTSLYGVYC
jgi:hypothetical protein